MRRFLVLGGNGRLGRMWQHCMHKDAKVIVGSRSAQTSDANDYSHIVDYGVNELVEAIEVCQVDTVINCAGMTNVDTCEKYPELARYSNSVIAGNIAIACQRMGVRLVHISTDHLFGNTVKPMTEEDDVSLINEYARSKYGGECAVLAECEEAMVVRTSFFGKSSGAKPTYSDMILRRLEEGEEIEVCDDIFFNPCLGNTLIENIMKLEERGYTGLINFSCDDFCSKFSFCQRLSTAFGYAKDQIKRSSQSPMRTISAKAPRPKNMVLDNTKAVRLLGHSLGSIQGHIDALYFLSTGEGK